MNNLVKKNILGIEVTDGTIDQVLEYIWESLDTGGDSYYVATPNPEMVVASQKHPELQQLLNGARISLCDGVGLLWASRILGKGLKTRVTGADLLEKICKESVRKPVNIGFLGGRDRVAERAAECLLKKYPGLKISYASGEWKPEGFRKIQMANGKWQMVNSIDILFVAFGFPKQEQWIADHLADKKFRIAVGVGGAFDYFSGKIIRAPKIFRTLGLEWLFRLVRQPWRAKRQLALVEFVGLVIKERLGNHQ